MTDYSKMSDFEINEAVSMALLSQSKNPEAKYVAVGNYCNSWADAGPIIASNRISLRNRHEGDWQAVNEWGVSHSYIDKNPLRAAMVVFLMMNEGEG